MDIFYSTSWTKTTTFMGFFRSYAGTRGLYIWRNDVNSPWQLLSLSVHLGLRLRAQSYLSILLHDDAGKFAVTSHPRLLAERYGTLTPMISDKDATRRTALL
jgi:hypothetical protein